LAVNSNSIVSQSQKESKSHIKLLKGVGEPGLVPTAPAIANAIYNAVGIRIHDLPITPEKMLKALKDSNLAG
jgi:CO/xanthine dehydrogenase Mo-binding subunit